MVGNGDNGGGGRKVPVPIAARDGKNPGWAKGLRQLYDSVVSEPLPDSFDDLLRKLDQAGDD
ncbi:MAG: hypothetical protein KGL44_00575 [Sphingomonadales bacterium]|nr:hypothetical protein [Sphingomonadales bacterium]